MEPSVYRQKWHKLRDSKADPEGLHHLSRQIALSFIDRYFQRDLYEPAYIDLLCEMATFYGKPDLDGIASSSLFGLVIEKLCDDFEELPIEAYVHVMCQMIACCRHLPAGRRLDETLTGLGIQSTEHLQQRAAAAHTQQHSYPVSRPPARILLLSRVTIGADVAILSVMIQRLRKLFPQADVVVVGHAKLHGLFDDRSAARIREINYARRGGLFERFAAWYAALDIVRDEMPLGGEQDLLVIDPDSRITQLGVLPLVSPDRYLFFNTRDPARSAAGHCMAEQANHWMDKVFKVSDFCFPTVWMAHSSQQTARTWTDKLRGCGAERIITVNFGVGQNPRKRVSLEFEKRLLRTLAATPNTVVILDRGLGPDEIERSAVLLGHARDCGLPTAETHFTCDSPPVLAHGVIEVESRIGEMAALISRSDEYIGYDSACQHIAAAAGTPTLTVFAGSNNMGFVRRWSACGNTECRIVHVNTLADPQHVDVDEVISRIMQERLNRPPRNSQTPVQETPTRRRKGEPVPKGTAR